MSSSDIKLMSYYEEQYRHEFKRQNSENLSQTLFTHQAIIGFFSLVMIMISFSLFIYDELTEPYMDEEFHVDQLRAYCAGNFSYWNNKLTTPPGLYLFTVGVFKPFKELYAFKKESIEEVCPLFIIRFTNFLFGLANFFLTYLIQIKLNSNNTEISKSKILLSSFSIISLPPLFFFNFLYYTDPGSLFFVLLMFLFDLENHTYLASLFGFLSLLFRQTNIVWVFFVAAQFSLRLLFVLKKDNELNRELIFYVVSNIIIRCAGYLLLAIGFIVFVFINNGIVLGDREAHQTVLHTGQLIYYLAFISFFAWHHLIQQFHNNLKFNLNSLFKYFMLIGFLSCLNIYAHPYLLADNRHYTFYAWRKIFNTSYSFLFIPIYALVLSLMYKKVYFTNNCFKFIFVFLHFLCTLITIVPAHLLEFRYFITSYIIWRLHLKLDSSFILKLELVTNFLINFITFYIFFYKTFYWPNNDKVQRFMW